MGYPVLSMDTKKKEHPGNFYRNGKVYTQAAIKTFDHDFTSAAKGVVIPHGLSNSQLGFPLALSGGFDVGSSINAIK